MTSNFDVNELLESVKAKAGTSKGLMALMGLAGIVVAIGASVAVASRSEVGAEKEQFERAQMEVLEAQMRLESFNGVPLPPLSSTWSTAETMASGCGVRLVIDGPDAIEEEGDYVGPVPHWKASLQGDPIGVVDCFETMLATLPIWPGNYTADIQPAERRAILRVAIFGRTQ